MPHLKLDDALVAMIRENQKILIDVWETNDLWLADINWEHPMCMEEALDTRLAVEHSAAKVTRYAEASHAIGFIAGCAAAFDVTPLELIDVVDGLPMSGDQRWDLSTGAMRERSFSLAKLSPEQREQALATNRLERQSTAVKKGPARKRRTRR
jgi:hypothetical protein